MTSALIAHCQWKVEAVRAVIGDTPSYTEAKKTKFLALHIHDSLGLA